jgi:exopolysaccharide production protein ExoZ
MIYNLHLLRALAALAVVYFHITSDAGLDLRPNIGAHGVDLFFVISGFIIAYVGSRSPERFLTRRLIRIVPFYWSATVVLFAAAVVLPHIFRSTRADPVQLLCSLFFIPRETAYAGLFPTLVLGWSLNYEMYFYVMFAASLAISKRLAPILCCIAIAAVTLAIDASGTANSSLLFYARTLVFEFVYGVGIFYALEAAERRVAWFKARGYIRSLLWCAAFAAVAVIGIEEYHHGFGFSRSVAAGVPALALVLSALFLERLYGISARSKIVFLVGESSYILYLIHPYVVYGVLRTVFAHRRHLTPVANIGIVTALLVVSTLVAIAVHLWFEKPVMAYLRRKLLAERAPRTGGAIIAPSG